MADERPLHVQVAEALGYTRTQQHECRPSKAFPNAICGWPDGVWTGVPPKPAHMRETDWQALIPRYDTDWSATGPLIEKYGIIIGPRLEVDTGEWDAITSYRGHYRAIGKSALEAVCRLILALHKAGKL